MRARFFILIALAFAASLSVQACGGAGSAPRPASACLEDGAQLEKDGSLFEPAHCMKACTQDNHCTVVNASCPGCCEFRAIGKGYEDHYAREKIPECKKYHGLVCGCDEDEPDVACVGNVCTLVSGG